MSYAGRADLYDLEYAFKDYAAECERICALVAERSPDARTLLDVACGTGGHLVHLRERFACEGVDLDPDLLAVARERLPDVLLHEADMRSFDLDRRFDVVTCLFSAIGFVGDLDGLARAADRLAAHVSDGGVLIVEPWVTPEAWIAGRPHALAAQNHRLALTRLTVSGREGRLAITDMHYVASDGSTVDEWRDRHEIALFTHDEMRAAFEATGLQVEHDPEGLIGRGLWIATRG